MCDEEGDETDDSGVDDAGQSRLGRLPQVIDGGEAVLAVPGAGTAAVIVDPAVLRSGRTLLRNSPAP
ncbi:hypothetical protein ACFPZI_16305 [Streptomyces chlorus]|uniref:Uncharacterized protein n=1 Tax=Streptomyces chlorus TaxID=887452 RepID=A0ABW1DZZ2_9ACTN